MAHPAAPVADDANSPIGTLQGFTAAEESGDTKSASRYVARSARVSYLAQAKKLKRSDHVSQQAALVKLAGIRGQLADIHMAGLEDRRKGIPFVTASHSPALVAAGSVVWKLLLPLASVVTVVEPR